MSNILFLFLIKYDLLPHLYLSIYNKLFRKPTRYVNFVKNILYLMVKLQTKKMLPDQLSENIPIH